jgi:hypothetical protein
MPIRMGTYFGIIIWLGFSTPLPSKIAGFKIRRGNTRRPGDWYSLLPRIVASELLEASRSYNQGHQAGIALRRALKGYL